MTEVTAAPAGPPMGHPAKAPTLIAVRSCSRLGRCANPPRSGLALPSWLRGR
jgi:hypothetical protein